jgi:hypothetical protein
MINRNKHPLYGATENQHLMLIIQAIIMQLDEMQEGLQQFHYQIESIF